MPRIAPTCLKDGQTLIYPFPLPPRGAKKDPKKKDPK